MARLLKDWKDANFWPTDMHSIECAEKIVKFYEDLIDRGTLRVVEEVEWDEVEDRCLNCGFGNDGNYVGTNYCPGCGGKLK